jgi:hypothetical protein
LRRDEPARNGIAVSATDSGRRYRFGPRGLRPLHQPYAGVIPHYAEHPTAEVMSDDFCQERLT